MTAVLDKARAKANWIGYWHVRRRSHNWFIAAVWKLPRAVVYWCVIRAACKVESNSYPGDVTAEQMLKAWGQ